MTKVPGNQLRRRRTRSWGAGVAGSLVLASMLLLGCGQDVPDVPEGADAALVEGRSVWKNRCATCHGGSGGGGTGPAQNDASLLEKYPTADAQAAVIAGGRNKMPSFGGSLSESQIDAVVRYTREVLVQP
jgi:mono/diheme cytochrome c family protein